MQSIYTAIFLSATSTLFESIAKLTVKHYMYLHHKYKLHQGSQRRHEHRTSQGILFCKVKNCMLMFDQLLI